MKLLLLEDSEAVRQRVASVLGYIPGVQIEEAANVAEAREILLKGKLDAVVLDIQLPDGSGLDLLGFIKDKLPGACNIVFTNHLHYKQHCLSGGADYFFDKSMELENLVRVVTMLAARGSDGEN